MRGTFARCRSAIKNRRIECEKARLRPGFFYSRVGVGYFAALIERSTVSLGQQSTFNPAFFW